MRALLLLYIFNDYLYIFNDYWGCYYSAGTVVYNDNSLREAEQERAMMAATDYLTKTEKTMGAAAVKRAPKARPLQLGVTD